MNEEFSLEKHGLSREMLSRLSQEFHQVKGISLSRSTAGRFGRLFRELESIPEFKKEIPLHSLSRLCEIVEQTGDSPIHGDKLVQLERLVQETAKICSQGLFHIVIGAPQSISAPSLIESIRTFEAAYKDWATSPRPEQEPLPKVQDVGSEELPEDLIEEQLLQEELDKELDRADGVVPRAVEGSRVPMLGHPSRRFTDKFKTSRRRYAIGLAAGAAVVALTVVVGRWGGSGESGISHKENVARDNVELDMKVHVLESRIRDLQQKLDQAQPGKRGITAKEPDSVVEKKPPVAVVTPESTPAVAPVKASVPIPTPELSAKAVAPAPAKPVVVAPPAVSVAVSQPKPGVEGAGNSSVDLSFVPQEYLPADGVLTDSMKAFRLEFSGKPEDLQMAFRVEKVDAKVASGEGRLVVVAVYDGGIRQIYPVTAGDPSGNGTLNPKRGARYSIRHESMIRPKFQKLKASNRVLAVVVYIFDKQEKLIHLKRFEVKR